MTERLRRVHALLRSGNVPCELTRRPDLGVVVLAGTPNHGPWDVLLRENAGELWIHDARGDVRLPTDAADIMVANAVKFRVVQAWADQGDPEAKAVVAKLNATRNSSAPPAAHQPEHAYYVSVQLVDPLQLAAHLFDAFAQVGWSVLSGRLPSYPFPLNGWAGYFTPPRR